MKLHHINDTIFHQLPCIFSVITDDTEAMSDYSDKSMLSLFAVGHIVNTVIKQSQLMFTMLSVIVALHIYGTGT